MPFVYLYYGDFANKYYENNKKQIYFVLVFNELFSSI